MWSLNVLIYMPVHIYAGFQVFYYSCVHSFFFYSNTTEQRNVEELEPNGFIDELEAGTI